MEKDILSILYDAHERMSECDVPFLVQDMEELIEEVEAIGIADQGCKVPG